MADDVGRNQYWSLTERVGEPVSEEQLRRMYTRYIWAAQYCRDRDVLEVACGVGQGLGIISTVARSLKAGDQSPKLLDLARTTYGASIDLRELDAQELPFSDQSFDVVLISEAIYYLPDIDAFIRETRRVLRSHGLLLIVTANKDLYDFHRSPHSHTYLGAVELNERLKDYGFDAVLFGDTPTSSVSWRQRLLRPIKAIAARAGLIPKTIDGRAWMKRIVFGRMVAMPAALPWDETQFRPPTPISTTEPDREHKVLLCAATKRA